MFKTNQDRKKIKRSKTIGDSVTEQSHKKGTDINHLVNLYANRGGLPEVDPSFFQEALSVDFKDAMDLIVAADQKFAELPAEVRNRFEHDPSRMMKFFEDGGKLVGEEFMTAEEFTAYQESINPQATEETASPTEEAKP